MNSEVDLHDMDLSRPSPPHKQASSVIFWFRARSDASYHAYRSRRFGEPSICGHGSIIIEVNEMDSGGNYSKCCLECFRQVYGINLPGRRK